MFTAFFGFPSRQSLNNTHPGIGSDDVCFIAVVAAHDIVVEHRFNVPAFLLRLLTHEAGAQQSLFFPLTATKMMVAGRIVCSSPGAFHNVWLFRCHHRRRRIASSVHDIAAHVIEVTRR